VHNCAQLAQLYNNEGFAQLRAVTHSAQLRKMDVEVLLI
jgi:hypothetical protein